MALSDDDLKYAISQGLSDEEISQLDSESNAPVSRLKSPLDIPVKPSMLSVVRNATVKGVANTGDMILSAPQNLVNLGAAGAGVLAQKAGLTDTPVELPFDAHPDYLRKALTDIGSIRPEDEPQTAGQRIVDTAVQGGVGMLTGGGTKNAAQMLSNTLLGTGIAGSSQAVKEITGSDKAALATNLILSAAIPALGAKGIKDKAAQEASLLSNKTRNAEIDKNLTDALDAGYKIPPAMLNERKQPLLEKALQKMGGKSEVETQASINNREITNKLAREDIGLPVDEPIISEAIQAKNKELSKVYDTVRNQPDLKIDSYYRPSDLSPAIDRSVGLDMSQKNHIKAGDAVDAIKQLRADAKGIYNSPKNDPEKTRLADSMWKEANSLEGLIERNLKENGNGHLMNILKGNRIKMARNDIYDKAILQGAGEIDSKFVARELQKGNMLTRNAETMGKFANVYSKANKTSKQISSKDSGGLGLMMTTAAHSNPASTAASILYNLTGRGLARDALLSNKMQKNIVPKYEVSNFVNALTKLPTDQQNALLSSLIADKAMGDNQ